MRFATRPSAKRLAEGVDSGHCAFETRSAVANAEAQEADSSLQRAIIAGGKELRLHNTHYRTFSLRFLPCHPARKRSPNAETSKPTKIKRALSGARHGPVALQLSKPYCTQRPKRLPRSIVRLLTVQNKQKVQGWEPQRFAAKIASSGGCWPSSTACLVLPRHAQAA